MEDCFRTGDDAPERDDVSAQQSPTNPQDFASDAFVTFGFGEPVGGRSKRFFDVVLASGALLFFLPALLLIAIAIKFSSPGPILYSHGRVGFKGRSFKCLKFRTMAVNGDEVLREYLTAHPDAAQEWARTRKLRRDPRITAIGHLLRKSSLDELPQFVNVLRGEMSLVGPRPIVTEELAHYGDNAMHYLRSKPGVTGLWQISGRSNTTYDQRVRYDVDYVDNWSLLSDARITLLTVPAVLLQRGSA